MSSPEANSARRRDQTKTIDFFRFQVVAWNESVHIPHISRGVPWELEDEPKENKQKKRNEKEKESEKEKGRKKEKKQNKNEYSYEKS